MKLNATSVRKLACNDDNYVERANQSFECSSGHFAKKMSKANSIKSFWSSNVSLASTSTQANQKLNILSTSKRMLHEFLTTGGRTEAAAAAKTCLARSHTMKATERRKLFNRSSSRNFANRAHPVQVDKTPNKPDTNVYDKLFINQKSNAANKLLAKQLEDEATPYCHIYKDFTVDCLKPFFQIDKIEGIQCDESASQQADANSSIVSAGVEEPTADKPMTCTTNEGVDQQRYIYIGLEAVSSSSSSPSNSLCLSSSSFNSSKSANTEQNESSAAAESDSPGAAAPRPQPRSIYLTYESYKKSQRLLLNRQQKDKQLTETKVKNCCYYYYYY